MTVSIFFSSEPEGHGAKVTIHLRKAALRSVAESQEMLG
jgi:hypothetical protein